MKICVVLDAVEAERERQAQPTGEVVAVERGLRRGVDPVERDRPAAVAEVIELAPEREVELILSVDELHAGRDARLGAAAGRGADRRTSPIGSRSV